MLTMLLLYYFKQVFVLTLIFSLINAVVKTGFNMQALNLSKGEWLVIGVNPIIDFMITFIIGASILSTILSIVIFIIMYMEWTHKYPYPLF